MSNWTFEKIPIPKVDWGADEFSPDPDDWKKWVAYCEKKNWYPLWSGRLAWCNDLSTYVRGGEWIARHKLTDSVELVDDDLKAALEKE